MLSTMAAATTTQQRRKRSSSSSASSSNNNKNKKINILVTHHHHRLLLYGTIAVAAAMNIETLYRASSLTGSVMVNSIPYYYAYSYDGKGREMAAATNSSSSENANNINNRTTTTANTRIEEEKIKNEVTKFEPLLLSSSLDTVLEDPESYVAGCLKISDDNHWLVEWLAYHYWALPLRRLIVLIDQRSITSPVPIFDRWKHRIKIEYVNATLYTGYTRVNRDTDADRIHMGSHLAFVTSCLRMYKNTNPKVKWVASIDTDEFVYVNPQTRNASHALYRPNVPSMDQPGHILSLIKEEEEQQKQKRRMHENRNNNNMHVDPCISMARIQMTQKESSTSIVESNVPDGLAGEDFLTLRFLKEASEPKAVIRGKNIVNMRALSRGFLYGNLDLTLKGSTHQIIFPYCDNMPKRDDSLLLVNHYPGTTEQYKFRTNDPRGRNVNHDGTDEKGQDVSDDDSTASDHYRPWLRAFVGAGQNENEEEARRRLLEGAGRTHSWPSYRQPNMSLITWCTIDNGCMPPITPGKRARAQQKNNKKGSQQQNKSNNNKKPLIQVPPPSKVKQQQQLIQIQAESPQVDVRAAMAVILRKLDKMTSELTKLNDKVSALQEEKD